MPDENTFGRRLAQARAGRGLKAFELAAKLNVAPFTVSQWENDHRLPSTERLLEICDTLHVSADVLLGRVPFQLGPMPEAPTAAAEHAPHCIFITSGAGCTCGRV